MIWKLAHLMGVIEGFLENLFLPKARSPRHIEGHTLYQFQLSPYCLKVRLAMRRMGIEIQSADTLASQRAYEELMAGGKKDKVPCLRIAGPNGTTRWMYESKAIIEYLENLSAPL